MGGWAVSFSWLSIVGLRGVEEAVWKSRVRTRRSCGEVILYGSEVGMRVWVYSSWVQYLEGSGMGGSAGFHIQGLKL